MHFPYKSPCLQLSYLLYCVVYSFIPPVHMVQKDNFSISFRCVFVHKQHISCKQIFLTKKEMFTHLPFQLCIIYKKRSCQHHQQLLHLPADHESNDETSDLFLRNDYFTIVECFKFFCKLCFFSNDYHEIIFRATESVKLFCTYTIHKKSQLKTMFNWG